MIKKITLITLISAISTSSYAYLPYYKNHKPKQYIRLETGFIFKNKIEDNPGEDTPAAAEGGAAEGEEAAATGPQYPIYKTNQNIFGGAAIGYEFMENYRAELNFIYNPNAKTKIQKQNGYAELTSSNIAMLANIYFAPRDFELLSPYVFFGMGFARNRVSNIKDFNKDNGLLNTQMGGGNTHYAWNLGAGITMDFTERMVVDLGYRYMDYGTLKSRMRGTYGPAHEKSGLSHTDPTYNYNFGKVKSHQIALSLRYFVK